MSNKGAMEIMYGSVAGRSILNLLLKAGLPKVMASYLHSPLSRSMIGNFVKKNSINMDEYEAQDYSNFADFFIRKRCDTSFDADRSHLISPCDSLLSVFTIDKDSCFGIKGSEYRISDLLCDDGAAKDFEEGICLIFRLQANDYHRYCYIDDCYVGENRFYDGELHSVQPIACTHYPVYRLNRRMCTMLNTDNFGTVAQIEVGAMAVGGIVNLHENCRVSKGQEMGRFELCGSTIVMLFEKGRIELSPELSEIVGTGSELPVRYGRSIGMSR